MGFNLCCGRRSQHTPTLPLPPDHEAIDPFFNQGRETLSVRISAIIRHELNQGNNAKRLNKALRDMLARIRTGVAPTTAEPTQEELMQEGAGVGIMTLEPTQELDEKNLASEMPPHANTFIARMQRIWQKCLSRFRADPILPPPDIELAEVARVVELEDSPPEITAASQTMSEAVEEPRTRPDVPDIVQARAAYLRVLAEVKDLSTRDGQTFASTEHKEPFGDVTFSFAEEAEFASSQEYYEEKIDEGFDWFHAPTGSSCFELLDPSTIEDPKVVQEQNPYIFMECLLHSAFYFYKQALSEDLEPLDKNQSVLSSKSIFASRIFTSEKAHMLANYLALMELKKIYIMRKTVSEKVQAIRHWITKNQEFLYGIEALFINFELTPNVRFLTEIPNEIRYLFNCSFLDIKSPFLTKVHLALPNLRQCCIDCSNIASMHFDEGLPLQELEIINNNQILEIPSDITKLSSLKKLRLEKSSKLTTLDNLPPTLLSLFLVSNYQIEDLSSLSLPNLEQLIIDGLNTDKLCTFANVAKLRDLSITNNDRITAIPEDVNNLQFLQKLRIAKCSKLISIGRLPSSLRRLFIVHNANLTGFEEGLSWVLPSAHKIRLANNSLNGRLPFDVKDLPQLEVLDISANAYTRLPEAISPSNLSHVILLLGIEDPFEYVQKYAAIWQANGRNDYKPNPFGDEEKERIRYIFRDRPDITVI